MGEKLYSSLRKVIIFVLSVPDTKKTYSKREEEIAIDRAVHAAAVLKTIDIDHPLCRLTGISPAALFYAGGRKGGARRTESGAHRFGIATLCGNPLLFCG